jgi:hypothetical protein
VSTADTNRSGLFQGDSGPALFLLRLFEHTGDPSWLNAPGRALARELGRCVRVERNGSVQLNEGWRGAAVPQDGQRGHLAGILDGIRRAAGTEFVIQPGLFNGRAGMIGALCLLRSSDADDAIIRRHLHLLAWHAVDHHGRLAFPGEQLLRPPMDFASGNAGILTAVQVVLHGGELLPFLRSARSGSRRARAAIARALVAGGWVLPLLDGLDEMDPDHTRPNRARHVLVALDQPAGDTLSPPLVLTCRNNCYHDLTILARRPRHHRHTPHTTTSHTPHRPHPRHLPQLLAEVGVPVVGLWIR